MIIDKSLARANDGLLLTEAIIYSDFKAISALTQEICGRKVGCKISVVPGAREPLSLSISPEVADLLGTPQQIRAKTPFDLHDRLFPFIKFLL